jgi:hypothetical protein
MEPFERDKMNDNNIDKFIELSIESWKKIYEGNSKLANSKIKLMDEMVEHWQNNGNVLKILMPLLECETDSVRYSAAAYLMNSSEREKAIFVLGNLVKDSSGLISPGAAAVLRAHKVPSDG